jgi:hypothetical protein
MARLDFGMWGSALGLLWTFHVREKYKSVRLHQVVRAILKKILINRAWNNLNKVVRGDGWLQRRPPLASASLFYTRALLYTNIAAKLSLHSI